MKKTLFSIVLICLAASAFAVNLSWQIQNLSYSNLKAVDIKQNTNGIYALMKIDYPGTNFNNGDSDRIYIVKYNTSGAVVNTFKYTYLQFARQEPKTLLLGNSGIVYVLFTNYGTTGFKEYFVLKLNSTLTTELGLFSPNLGTLQREANTMCFADSYTSIILSTYKYQTGPTAYYTEFTKIDLNGNQIWNYSINSGSTPSYIYDLKVKSDRVLACGMKSVSSLWKIWALSFNNSGQLNFEFTAGGSAYGDGAYELESDNLKNTYLCGSKYSNTAKQYLWYMNKLDSAGNLIWSKTYIPDPPLGNLSSTITLMDMAIDSQNNLYYLGGTGVNASKTRLLKLDSSGNKLWAKIFNNTSPTTEGACDLKISSTDKIYAATVKINGSYNTHLYQYDSNGNKLDEDTCFIRPSNEMRLAYNNVLLAGTSQLATIYVPGFAKFDATPIRQPNEFEFNALEKTISFYPNPASTKINFNCDDAEKKIEVSIYNTQGALIKQSETTADKPYPVYDFPNGYYVVSVSSNQFSKRLKLLVRH